MAEDNLPVFYPDHDQVEALFNPQPNIGNIDQLQAFFVERTARAAVLPFPPDLVDEITDFQVSALQDIFEIPDGDRYYQWRAVYADVQEELASSRMEPEDTNEDDILHAEEQWSHGNLSIFLPYTIFPNSTVLDEHPTLTSIKVSCQLLSFRQEHLGWKLRLVCTYD